MNSYNQRFGPFMTIRVKCENTVLATFNMYPNTPFYEVSHRLDRGQSDYYLMVNKTYQYIDDGDTPASLGLTDGDVVRYVERGCARVHLWLTD